MVYAVAADIVVFLHFLWIVFLIFGAIPGRRHNRMRGIHISGLILAVVIQARGWYCPLTYLEIWLRRMHDPSKSYAGSFIVHYMEKIVYIDVSWIVIRIMTVLLIAVSVFIYMYPAKKRKS